MLKEEIDEVVQADQEDYTSSSVTSESLSKRVQKLKKMILESTRSELNARSFDIPGSDTVMISALAELLIFFSIGTSEARINLELDVLEWWQGFCLTLSKSGKSAV